MENETKTNRPASSNYKAGKDYIEKIRNVDLPMVYVEGGEFMMGAAEEEKAYHFEKPAHKVTLSSYHIGKYPVTQGQWRVVMDENPSYHQGEKLPKGVKGDSLPVENITWQMAAKFCERLSAMTGKKYVLPTEAQWEFAARGGVKSKGCLYSGSNNLDEVAWYDENSRDKPQEEGRSHEVGTKAPNELGIYDMSGNVWEWCEDWYGAYSSEPASNPTGAASGKYRVLRGGSWISYIMGCRVSNRSGDAPDNHIFNLGFRVACEG